jgi:hypothetical protein
LGFPVDVDDGGNPMHRPAEIMNEACQRSKCLSHEHQRNLRVEQINIATQKVAEAEEKERVGREEILATNLQAEN